ncbi:hypothetical protein PPACK8108_LOCUS17052 [Phakopsora pachyrhizi]|uniref:Uncharacterized protein n=1 Tax=Phakopsora pachyrhizi TaxID=170000 RepID=A0AAV0BAA1_PHAPC|nr:hypothetical protein PPACK8108_LOCUS17052 [Phakopsora pachyrhizi]
MDNPGSCACFFQATREWAEKEGLKGTLVPETSVHQPPPTTTPTVNLCSSLGSEDSKLALLSTGWSPQKQLRQAQPEASGQHKNPAPTTSGRGPDPAPTPLPPAEGPKPPTPLAPLPHLPLGPGAALTSNPPPLASATSSMSQAQAPSPWAPDPAPSPQAQALPLQAQPKEASFYSKIGLDQNHKSAHSHIACHTA